MKDGWMDRQIEIREKRKKTRLNEALHLCSKFFFFSTPDALGIVSYQLSTTAGESFIKYENTPQKLDNCKALPLTVYYKNDSFDRINKRFRGIVRWHPITFDGDSCWKYDFTFDEN